jgi:hypothetical protein
MSQVAQLALVFVKHIRSLMAVGDLNLGLRLSALGDAGMNDAIGQKPIGLSLFVL